MSIGQTTAMGVIAGMAYSLLEDNCLHFQKDVIKNAVWYEKIALNGLSGGVLGAMSEESDGIDFSKHLLKAASAHVISSYVLAHILGKESARDYLKLVPGLFILATIGHIYHRMQCQRTGRPERS